MEKENLNNGHVLEVTKDMFEKAAIDFSEGNENLRKLLMYCFENNIKTSGCCSGHNGKTRPYIQFKFDDNNMEAILKLLNNLSLGDNITDYTIMKQPGVISGLCVSMLDDKYDEGFYEILDSLKNEKKIQLNDLDEIKQKIIKSAKKHDIKNSYMELKETKDSVSIAVDDNYINVLPSTDNLEPWTEETQISEYKKGTAILNTTLTRLESKTKNIDHERKYISNKVKIDEFLELNNMLINIDNYRTNDRIREFKELNVFVGDAVYGASIEDVAKQVMELEKYGQASIIKFNDFKFDTRDYTSADEIINLYYKDIETKVNNKKGKIKIEDKKEEIIEATEDVRNSKIEEVVSTMSIEMEKEKNNISHEKE